MHLPIVGQVAIVNSMLASMMWYFINVWEGSKRP
jgi:hypothetical protein